MHSVLVLIRDDRGLLALFLVFGMQLLSTGTVRSLDGKRELVEARNRQGARSSDQALLIYMIWRWLDRNKRGLAM